VFCRDTETVTGTHQCYPSKYGTEKEIDEVEEVGGLGAIDGEQIEPLQSVKREEGQEQAESEIEPPIRGG